MATFEEGFVYPLILLLIGAGVSGGLITWFTHWLEDRRKQREIEVEYKRKKLEIKVGIASKMADIISYQLVSADIAVLRKKKTSTAAEEDAYYEYLKKPYVDSNIISSKLES